MGGILLGQQQQVVTHLPLDRVDTFTLCALGTMGLGSHDMTLSLDLQLHIPMHI